MSIELSSQTPALHRARYHPLMLVFVGMATGMLVDRLWPVMAIVWFAVAVGTLVAWSVAWYWSRTAVASMLLLLSFASAGAAWHHDRWQLYREDEVGRMVQEQIRPLVLEGTAMQSPRWVPAPPPTALRTVPKGDETELLLWVTSVRNGREWQSASGWASLDVDGHLTGVRAGDRLRIMALASQPMKPLNPREFNFATYERNRRVLCRLRGLFPECVTVVERGSPWSLRRAIGKLREHGNTMLRRNIGSQRATLAAAILIGAREQLDADRNENFLVTGTIHVLSISGLHVGILALGFWWLFRTGLLPRTMALVTAMGLTTLYVILTDAQPPVVRATILVIVMCLARLLHRRALGFNTLAIAGIVVLMLQPSSLFQAGPQLSFLSVAAMIAAHPLLSPNRSYDPLDRLIASTRPWPVRTAKWAAGVVWRVWLTGAVVWTVTLPLVWYHYKLLSPIALVLNVVVWAPITLALFAGFGALVFGWVAPPLGRFFGWVCDANLAAIETCIGWGRGVSGSYFWHPGPPGWWVVVFYVVAAAVCLVPWLRLSRRWIAVLLIGWFAAAVLLASHADWLGQREKSMRCTFVAVGHGTAVILEADGRTLLYDAGHMGSPLGAARPVSEVLWSRGVTHIDAVIVSHADSDHFNGLPELLQRFSVGRICVSPVMFEATQPAVQELRVALSKVGLSIDQLSAGDRLKLGDLSCEVLHPPRKGVIGTDNANSIVLLVEYEGRRILLPGDLEPPGLEDLLAEEPLDCDIVMAPHHGSRRSDPTGFSLWSTPDYVVISGSRNAEDEAEIASVEYSYAVRGGEVFHTAKHGAVEFEISADGVQATTFRGELAETNRTLVNH